MNEYYVYFRTRNRRLPLLHSKYHIRAMNELEAIRIACGQYDTQPGLSPYDGSKNYDIHAEKIEEIEF